MRLTVTGMQAEASSLLDNLHWHCDKVTNKHGTERTAAISISGLTGCIRRLDTSNE